ncbi:replication endonuclease [Lelliottia sp. V89_10]|nr:MULTISPECIES: replication endonuclease [unclassified Lelliottia]MDI3359611.1 replication endonuclease [Lelliottia sp. V89_13]MDK9548569.1 replication endonuclease [Lelliottia sp. V89_5]MDK9595169.1 replication endonuclease [Lelliottia sp. V89_10]
MRRKSLEYFQSHELINTDGDTLDRKDVVNASSSNPAHRRNEMMACVKGLELTARLRLVNPKRRKGYKQEISGHHRLQHDAELRFRGGDASETEADLLLRSGSLTPGAELRLFYRNQRLQEEDKLRQWY